MKRILKDLFYTSEHEKLTDENIVRQLLPSVIGIIICMVCMAGMSLAWFNANVQTGLQDIKTASYNISVSVKDLTNGGTEVNSNNGVYELKAQTQYEILLTAGGNASTGYCRMISDSVSGCSDAINNGDSLKFYLIPDNDGNYTFESVWGSYSGETVIKNNGTIGNVDSLPVEESNPEEQLQTEEQPPIQATPDEAAGDTQTPPQTDVVVDQNTEDQENESKQPSAADNSQNDNQTSNDGEAQPTEPVDTEASPSEEEPLVTPDDLNAANDAEISDSESLTPEN